MSKEELLELKKKLLVSRKYYLVNIEGRQNNKIILELFTGNSYLSENIKLYDEEADRIAVMGFEDSCERLIRKLAEENIDYDRLNVKILPLFYAVDSLLNKVDDEGLTLEEDLTEFDILYDRVKILYDFEVYKENKKQVLPQSVELVKDDIMSQNFLVDYENFINLMRIENFDIIPYSFKKLVNIRKEGKNIQVTIDFQKQKEYKL